MRISPQKEPNTWRWNKKLYYQMAEMGWFQDKRVELIEGEIIEMSPIGSLHWVAVNLLSQRLRDIFTDGYIVSVQSSVDLGPVSEPTPDIAFVEGDVRDYKRALPTTAILVVEVADSSLAYDRAEKASLYAQAGIKEYWIVNLVDRQLEVHREPVALKDQILGFGYAHRTIYSSNEEVASLAKPDAIILVDDILP